MIEFDVPTKDVVLVEKPDDTVKEDDFEEEVDKDVSKTVAA